MTAHTFRAIWPVTDPSIPLPDLIAQAEYELPDILTRAHARVTGPGRWAVLPSSRVAGSGRVTPHVLVYDAPATPVQPRAYRKAVA